MNIVHCKLPNTGLGNQLFPLLKTYMFGALNQLPVVTTGYHRFKIGPYLRNEKSKRRYRYYFVFQKSLIRSWIDLLKIHTNWNLTLVKEPYLEKVLVTSSPCRYEFHAIPHWDDYFSQLKERRETVISLFHSLLCKSIIKLVNEQSTPCIGVHIRMGDYRKLQDGEDFRKVGAVRTPENYFIEMILAIRRINGINLPVSVFTDGYRHEFENLWDLENIYLVEGNPDIVDMILLSRSQIIIASAGSTFSYWAGFLANAPLIMHPDHLHAPLRPSNVNCLYYEGALLLDRLDPLLEKNIKSIH